jgi:hypothetical protein
MATVTTSLREQAESIFTELGYQVSGAGREFRAERKWRTVQVTPMRRPDGFPRSGEYRCFVTWADELDRFERRLAEANLDYEWAVIGVERSGGYTVSRAD